MCLRQVVLDKFIETYCSPRAEVKTYKYTVRIPVVYKINK